MKKIIWALCCFILCFSLVACGDEDFENLSPEEKSVRYSWIILVKNNAIHRIIDTNENDQGSNDIWNSQTHTRYDNFLATAKITANSQIDDLKITHVNKIGENVCTTKGTTVSVLYIVKVYIESKDIVEVEDKLNEGIKAANIRAVKSNAVSEIFSARIPTSATEDPSGIFSKKDGKWELIGPWKCTAYVTKSGKIEILKIEIVAQSDVRDNDCIKVTSDINGLPTDAEYYVTVYITQSKL